MTRKDIDDIISILCPNDEDYEKPIISPKYLRQELEQLALEQVPCEDAISRQAVLELIDFYDGQNQQHFTVDNLRDDVENVPSVILKAKIRAEIVQSRWIPVSERLPEEDEDVLVQMTDYSMMVDFRTASSSGWFWAEKDDLPMAWMPLPEPYKVESEE